jgi:tetratricopeptide (TPR) repeat protein
MVWEGFLSRFFGLRFCGVFISALFGLIAPACVAQNSPITLDTNETLFSVLAAINSCGYDQSLTISDAMRSNVRAEVQRNIKASEEAKGATTTLCDFYQTHRAKDPAHDLSQYVSLALYLDGPPHFVPKVKEDEMPPDAAAIAAFGAVLERFYDKAQLHTIWEHDRTQYAALAERYHQPLAGMVFDNEIYLKLASAAYLGRTFTVYMDFLGDPNQTNARNYGSDYYVVVFPSPESSTGASLKMDQVRHTYLHYLLDPLSEKHFSSMKRLEPLLQFVKRAPLEEDFKSNISLLVTECLVRAIEIRTIGNKHTPEAQRTQAVDDAVRQGYILTRYFYDSLLTFEKDPAGIRTAFSGFLDGVDVKKEEKAASGIQFAGGSAPELVQLSRLEDRQMLVSAEKRLAAGDPKGAQQLAQQAIDRKIGDQGRALFILAEVAVASKDMAGARDNFQKAIQQAKDPKVIGWSHVYLGRILDLKDERDAAVIEYRAALDAGGALPEIKTAAERGLEAPYEPPAKTQQ